MPATPSPRALRPRPRWTVAGPSVVVGDRAGNVYAFHLSNGSAVSGWPAHAGGPIDSTPSVSPERRRHRQRVRRRRQRSPARTSGATTPSATPGPSSGSRTPKTRTASTACRPRWRWATSEASPAVVAPSLGQDEYAFNAANGAVLPGWPFFTADSGFTTPSLADLYGNGQTEIVEGGDSSAGVAYGPDLHRGRTPAGARGRRQPDLRLRHQPDGRLVDRRWATSSPAAQVGIAFGTGSYYAGASDSNTLFAIGLPLQHRLARQPRWHHHRQPGHRRHRG